MSEARRAERIARRRRAPAPMSEANSAEERYEDLVRSAADSEYQKELMRKYQIT